MTTSNSSVPAMFDRLSELTQRHAVDASRGEQLQTSVPKIIEALESFGECVRYLNTRRSSGAVLNLESEADVQDVLYLMLRSWILDLTPENPTDKVANTFSIQDFASRKNRCVIEVKYVRDKDHGKRLAKEINDDIENYRYHAHCDD